MLCRGIGGCSLGGLGRAMDARASVSSSIEVYSTDSDLYDSDYEAVMEDGARSPVIMSSVDMSAPAPPLPQRSVSGSWTTATVPLGDPLGSAAHSPVSAKAPEPVPAPEPEPEPESEPEASQPVPASPSRDPRLKLLAPSSPAGSATRDPRLHLFNRRQRQRPRAVPATTATARPTSQPRASRRAKSPGLTVAVAADGEGDDAAEPAQSPSPSAVPADEGGSSTGEGYQTLARIERTLDSGAWQERVASLTELATIAKGGAAARTIGATLRHVVVTDVCCGVQPGQLGTSARGGGKVIKASRGRTLVRGLEQQLNDQRPMILREAAAAVGALAKLCGTAHKWQATSGRMLPRLCSMCTLGPKLVCAASDAAVTTVLEDSQPPMAISVLTTVATTQSMHAARRAHAFACLGRVLRCPAWADRPVLTRQRSNINATLTAGLADADASGAKNASF
jgi:hypothetical protein